MSCVCVLQRGIVVRGLGLGFTNHDRTGGILDVCLCLGCGGVVLCVRWGSGFSV